MSKTMEELAPAEKVEQLTDAAKKLTVEDLQSIQEIFGSTEGSREKDIPGWGFPCCCCA